MKYYKYSNDHGKTYIRFDMQNHFLRVPTQVVLLIANPVFVWPYVQCVTRVTNERRLFIKIMYCGRVLTGL